MLLKALVALAVVIAATVAGPQPAAAGRRQSPALVVVDISDAGAPSTVDEQDPLQRFALNQ